MAAGAGATRLRRIGMAAITEEDCRRDPEGAFHIALETMRAASTARKVRSPMPEWQLARTDDGRIVIVLPDGRREDLGPAEDALARIADFLELLDFGEVAPR